MDKEIEEAKQCLDEIIVNTYAEGKATKLFNLQVYIQQLETKVTELEEGCKQCIVRKELDQYINFVEELEEREQKVKDNIFNKIKNLKSEMKGTKGQDRYSYKQEIMIYENILNLLEGENNERDKIQSMG